MLDGLDIDGVKGTLLAEIGKGNAFAADMLAAILKGKVSPKQEQAIRGIVQRAEASSRNYGGILNAMRDSGEAFPKVVATIGGTVITLRYTPKGSVKAKPENRDTAYVSAGEYGSPSARWYGRIGSDGSFRAGKDFTPEVGAWLDSLNEGGK